MEPCARRRWRRSATGVGLSVLLLVALGARAESPTAAGTSDDDPGFWLLTEFDWGDDPEMVVDSLSVSPGYQCASGSQCDLVRVSVDGEHVVARFDYEHLLRKSLWRIAFLTPPLTRKQADDHLARVWGKLVGYVQRFHPEPALATDLPDLDLLVEGEPHYTHYWKTDEMEIRIALGVSHGYYYVGAYFSDPAKADRAKEGLGPNLTKAQRRKAAKSP